MQRCMWALGGTSRADSLWGVSRPAREKLLLKCDAVGAVFLPPAEFFLTFLVKIIKYFGDGISTAQWF